MAALGVLLRSIHTAWAALVLVAFGLLALVGMALLPALPARRRLARSTARASLACALMPVRTRLPAQVPDPCIAVANHESYLDGIVLTAALPPRFAFVIKREASAMPLAGWLLQRIGAQFVVRGQRAGSTRDALRVLRGAARGQSLAFFPEGTFDEGHGLKPFHTGAFVAAALAQAPVLPLVISGTRHCLQPGQARTRPGRIEVRALELLPAPSGPHAAAAARDAAHAAIGSALRSAQESASNGKHRSGLE